jgi:hypothetical protein
MDAGTRRGLPAISSANLCAGLRTAALFGVAAMAVSGCGKPERKLPVLPPRPPVVQQPAPPAPVQPAPPKIDTAAILFPRGPGDTWELSTLSDGQLYGLTMVVKDVTTESAGRVIFTIEARRGQEMDQRETYFIDDKGVFRTSAGTADDPLTFDPPLPVLTFPWKLGKSWTWHGKIGLAGAESVPAEATFTLTGPEELKTPAKKFVEVYKLVQAYSLTSAEGKQAWRNTQWLAPNVGLVKQDTDRAGQHTVAELVKYKVAPPEQAPDGAEKINP